VLEVDSLEIPDVHIFPFFPIVSAPCCMPILDSLWPGTHQEEWAKDMAFSILFLKQIN